MKLENIKKELNVNYGRENLCTDKFTIMYGKLITIK